MREIPKTGQFYRHFKGNLYQVITVAKHSETGESLVIYQALYGSYGVYARPLDMFLSEVDKEKYPQAEQAYRFEEVFLQQPEEETAVTPQSETGEPAEALQLGKHESEAALQSERHEPEAMPQAKISEPSKQVQETAPIRWDAGIEEFLDADSYQEKLRVFTSMQHRLTDDMIDIMAVSMDTEVNERELSDRIASLKNFLLMQVKYESNR